MSLSVVGFVMDYFDTSISQTGRYLNARCSVLFGKECLVTDNFGNSFADSFNTSIQLSRI
jgi:hypothetical protein